MTESQWQVTLRELPIRAVDCLKYIYKLRERGERVTTSGMRERLQAQEPDGQLSDATVTQLFKYLAAQGYVDHVPYKSVQLTATGERMAAELVRRHRLLEAFLFTSLHFSWDRVDAEAERLEHGASEELIDRMDEMLGFPKTDPHGDPIPNKEGEVVTPTTQPLARLEDGEAGIVRRVNDDSAEMLRYLADLELVPGAVVRMLGREPFEGPLRVEIGPGATCATREIGVKLAGEIAVEMV